MGGLDRFNWIDIVGVIILIRIGYVAIKSGFASELFKLLGTILAIYLSMHYYALLSDVISRWGAVESISSIFLSFIYFIILASLGYLIFVVLRRILSWLFQMETMPSFNKWGGLILGMIRGILLISLLICSLILSPFSYLNESVNHAYSGKYLLKIAPNTYSWLWDKVVSKFMTQEKFNKNILKVKIKPSGR